MHKTLTQPLHELRTDEIRTVRQIADTLFARLIQPFQQSHFVNAFNFKATIKSALKTGHLLPTYVRQERKHQKSNLVIAMSMSGIDRCFAVGLIPLLSQLKKYLHFQLFIYTDDLIEAKFGNDGFIANDCDIAWNNVIGPCVFQRLAKMDFDKNSKLLFIDSLGGGDSEWYLDPYSGSEFHSQKVKEAQRQFTVGYDNPWRKVREFLKGNFDKFDEVPQDMFPANWQQKLESNIQQRWINTPALKEYLIHYIFNPEYGKKEHGQGKSRSITSSMKDIKEKFKSVHVLTPSYTDYSKETLNFFKRHDFVDFHHKSDSLEGFAQTLINIVYGRETDKITKPVIRFTYYSDKMELGGDEEVGNHTEMVQANHCFAKCEEMVHHTTVNDTYLFPERVRSTKNKEMVPVYMKDIKYGKWEEIKYHFPNWSIDPLWTDFAKKQKAKECLKFIAEHEFFYEDGHVCLSYKKENDWSSLLNKVQYEKHHTKVLKPHVEDAINLFNGSYRKYFEEFPLRHAVWCDVPKFQYNKMAFSVCPSDNDDQKRRWTFHAVAHWAEHVCPLIGVYTNCLLEATTRRFWEKRLLSVNPGESSLFPSESRPQWINDYAGKYYRRRGTNLPNPTEIFSSHMEFFRSEESLVNLLEYDLSMARWISFIFMGGPLAIMKQMVAEKDKDVEREILYYGEKKNYYVPKGRQKAHKSSEASKQDKIQVDESKGFGI